VSGLEAIDLQHLGREQSICCYRQGDVIIDPGPQVSSQRVIDALGGEAPRAILLTHIHLDHAAATGSLIELWPETEVWVHERGAPHVIDPERLIASATRIYGDEMERLWGTILPVPAERVRVLTGTEEIGDWKLLYTPGHSGNHIAYLHQSSGTLFSGDVAGVRRLGGPVLAPTPPPEIDLEGWERSIQLIESVAPERLAVTHFGVYEEVDEHLGALREDLARAEAWAREVPDAEAYAAGQREWLVAAADEQTAAGYFAVMRSEDGYAGLKRALVQREE
jgi:glyoxylase-like metal-dependent hydrolase (beta-lactamase superfamily II)